MYFQILRRGQSYTTASLHSPTNYGHNYDEYAEIRRRVHRDRSTQKAVEQLQQRFRMLLLMCTDCYDLINERRTRQIYEGHLRVMYAAIPSMLATFVILTTAICCVSYLTYIIIRH